ncbi:hypothetical protein CPB86DRAFT_805075 [Serendipita vermifera]|nr:hypothetical protein CPB86DRAFT_805075 [Serendipita vermifera]
MPPATQDTKTNRRPCSECRRLKIRCDREVPCGNCKKRGVSSICPEGQLTYGGGRFVLAGTTELHARVQELSTRVMKLEAALEKAHAQISNDVHPLLREEERLDITVLSSDVQEEVQAHKWEESDTISDKFSMLSIDGDVRTTRFTPSFYSLWYLSETENPHSAPLHKASPDHISSFPTELLHVALGSFGDKQALLQRLLSCLPPPSVAQTLVDAYLFIREFWGIAYKDQQFSTLAPLAVLFMVFCLGACWLPHPIQGVLSPREYNQMAILCLSQEPVSIVHIEALILQTCYLCSADMTHGQAWSCLGLAIKLAQTLGIDRECYTWRISDEDKQRRRRIFHEINAIDCYLAMMVGRSNFLSRSQYNTPPPTISTVGPPEQITFEKASNWKYLFLGQGIQAMLALVLSADAQPTYKATLALDKKLRAYDSAMDPTFLKELGTPPEKNTAFCRSMRLRQFFVLLAKESTLLHLHRSFLNRAVINPDGDPILSKWSISVMAAYQSACAIIREVRLMRDHQPEALRVLSWYHAVITAVITLGALVIKTPFSCLATVAYQEMSSGCELLRRYFPPDYFLLPVLNRLEEAASGAYTSRDSHPLKITTAALPEVRRPSDGVEATQETTPVSSDGSVPMASQQTLEGVFDGDNELLDSTFFSTTYPLQPTHGGMNWHFIPRNPSKKNTIDETSVIDPGDANVLWAELLQQLSYSDPSLQSTVE